MGHSHDESGNSQPTARSHPKPGAFDAGADVVDNQLSLTDIAGPGEVLTGQRLLPRPGTETDPRIP
ncbi:hypothetical protein Rhow_002330 [Rhodococcus wratislaviensis]|uniref:Uncharacterized protein n=1 Tax=Rhodococcus wratislaviensis TaxID=44752 RepID=A0A402C5D5_RHOWR|nr:hypothetical protein Rhow_002330 [Rhodococcus wratislaviensis]